MRLRIDERVPSPAGRAVPASDQQFTIEVEKAFFIDGFRCSTECDPDGWNPVRMRSEVKVAEFAKAVKALDLTAAPARPVTKAGHTARTARLRA